MAGRGDRLVIRAYSPAATIGGARVLDPRPPKRRGALAREPVRALRAEDLPLAQVSLVLLDEAKGRGLSASALASRLAVTEAAVHAALGGLPTVLSLGERNALYVSKSALPAVAEAVRDVLARFHLEQPLRAGMAREELRKRLSGRVAEAVLGASLAAMAEAGQVRLTSETAALSTHAVTLAPKEQGTQAALLEAARSAGLQGVELKPLRPGPRPRGQGPRGPRPDARRDRASCVAWAKACSSTGTLSTTSSDACASGGPRARSSTSRASRR